MKLRLPPLLLMSGLLLAPVAHAEPPISVQIEISFLLGFVEGSGCLFNRNGTWRDSRAAQAHLRGKYKALAAQDLINSAGDFIDRAATESSISGQAYEVKCNGGATQTSKQWLRDELVRLRSFQRGTGIDFDFVGSARAGVRRAHPEWRAVSSPRHLL